MKMFDPDKKFFFMKNIPDFIMTKALYVNLLDIQMYFLLFMKLDFMKRYIDKKSKKKVL